jgi:hypothetical protein
VKARSYVVDFQSRAGGDFGVYIECGALSGQSPGMLDSTFEFRISAAGRRELTALADAIGVSAADVVRMSLRQMAASHQRKAKRGTTRDLSNPASPAAPPAIQAMDLPALYALRDELALKSRTSRQAEREHLECNIEIIKREMRSAPR